MGDVIEFPGAQAYDIQSHRMRRLTPDEVRREREYTLTERRRTAKEMLDWVEEQMKRQRSGWWMSDGRWYDASTDSIMPTKPAA